MKIACFLWFIFVSWNAGAQNINLAPSNSPPINADSQHAEEIRAKCLEGRRMICGKILKVLPEGLVVESGYTNLLREPLTKSWLLPGTVIATRPADLVEGKEPGCVAVGHIFLSNLPKARSTKPKQYDYVIIQGYPAGVYTYNSVGEIKKNIRRFATTLPGAVQINLQAEEKTNGVPVNRAK
jgi:hypothetical protein